MFKGLYNWMLPILVKYLSRYDGNENLYKAARALRDDLDSMSVIFFAVFVIFGILCAMLYYYWFNTRPHRHYKIGWWSVWLGAAAVATGIVTYVCGYLMVASQLAEKTGFLVRLAFGNALYAAVFYFILSFVICNLPFPTNAYRFLKIKKEK